MKMKMKERCDSRKIRYIRPIILFNYFLPRIHKPEKEWCSVNIYSCNFTKFKTYLFIFILNTLFYHFFYSSSSNKYHIYHATTS